ncbi:MAG: hypothetical protein F6K23_18985 [Okeania sp. SIO2C9]|uniref:hypothetical protein n=1 Tax=Okeania sp. SIO2C9 TaxID=2607791 RepID=UPI0013C158DC|nr:hypothetical protein [Okeania sp. SIO2C9]NEQ74939.1 hypothetical protein [Okeania sp. SIO2C9]
MFKSKLTFFRWLVFSVIGLVALWMIGGNLLASLLEKEIDREIAQKVKELEEQYPDPEPNDSALKLEAIFLKEFGMGEIGKANVQGVLKFENYMGYHPDFKESQESKDEFENIRESLDRYINSQISKPDDKSEIRSHYARNFRRVVFLILSSIVLAGGVLFWYLQYRPNLFLRRIIITFQNKFVDIVINLIFQQLDREATDRLKVEVRNLAFQQLAQEATDRLKVEVQKFLQKAGATTSDNGKHGLQITSAAGKLKSYIPIPVSLAIEQPDAQDVVDLVQQATKMKKSNQQQAGIIFYREPPDILFRLRMAEVRLRDRFILIPIPLTAVEKSLQEEKESSGLLADYTERYLPGADLFDDRNAIGDTLTFFGRGELLQRLEENLRRGQGIGIFGLRKSGKTSLLLQLGFAMRENPLVHIDLQTYGSKPHYGAELFNQILSKLFQLIESRSAKMVSHPKLFDSDRPAAHLTTEFTQQLQNLTQQLTEVGYQLPILIFLDEIDRIIPTETDAKERAEECNAFFGALRAVSQEKRSLSLLVADVHPDINRINQWKQPNVPTNPVFNFFKEIFVVPFSADETTRMLTDIGNLMGITFDEETQSEIHIRSGGHPFVSRQLASLLCKKVAKENESNIQFADAQRYLSKPFTYSGVLKDYCGQNIWSDIEKREFQSAMAIIRLLACNEKLESGIPSSGILKKLQNQFTESECLDALLWLESVGLILQQESGEEDEYQIKLPLLSQWLRMQMKPQEVQEWQIS